MSSSKPHGPDRLETGSVIGYTLVPINIVVPEVSLLLYAMEGEEFNKVAKTQNQFEECHQLVNQIIQFD